jgi:predicted metal-binding membrane protein
MAQRWRGHAQALHAFALGAKHGLFCGGCCWALMLLMLVLGADNIGWMLLFAAAMAVERMCAGADASARHSALR